MAYKVAICPRGNLSDFKLMKGTCKRREEKAPVACHKFRCCCWEGSIDAKRHWRMTKGRLEEGLNEEQTISQNRKQFLVHEAAWVNLNPTLFALAKRSKRTRARARARMSALCWADKRKGTYWISSARNSYTNVFCQNYTTSLFSRLWPGLEAI